MATALINRLSTKLAMILIIVRYRLGILRWALLKAKPIAGAAPDDDDDKDKAAGAGDDDDDDDDDANADKASSGDDDDADKDKDDAASGKQEPDWKRMARKHEREAKKARKERDAAAAKLKDREDADKSEQEKAIEQARDEERNNLKGEHEKERRQDRLETAATRIAAKGVVVGSGDDAKTLKFADPDDAMVHIERDIRNGDLDPEDIFDDNNRVKAPALEEALVDLLKRKPHLAADSKKSKVNGGADGGKGKATTTESSVDAEFKKLRRHQPAA